MKKSMQKMIMLLICISIFSCKKEENATFIGLFNVTKEINVTKFNTYINDSIQAPSQILSLNDYWLFVEPKCNNLLYIINGTDNKSKRLISKGQGSDELVDIQQIGYGNHCNSFYAHDVLLNKYHLYELKNDSINHRIYTFKDMDYSISAIAFDDSLSFFETVNSKNRFVIKTPTTQYSFGDNINIKKFSPEQVYQLLQGPCLISTKHKRLAWFSMYGDVMEIYDYTQTYNIKTICSKVIKLPSTSLSGIMRMDAHLGVSSIATDDKYIYALYNGKMLSEIVKDRDKAFFSDKIMIFDWDGNPVELWNLTHQISYITYNKQKHSLYGLGLDEEADYSIYEIHSVPLALRKDIE